MCKSLAGVFGFSFLFFFFFELLVSTLSCTVTHLLESAFTFSSFQIFSLFEKWSLLMVFEALFEDFYSSKFRSKTKILKAVERNGLSDTQQSVSFHKLFTCTVWWKVEEIYFQKTICLHTSFVVFTYSSDCALLISFVFFLVVLVTMLLESATSSSNLFLSSSKLVLEPLWCIFNLLVDFTIFLHELYWIVLLFRR